MAQVEWSDTAAPEVKKAAEKLCKAWVPILPLWLARLTLDYKQDDDDTGNMMGACSVNADYREATVYLLGKWLEEQAPRREWVVVHEYAHVLLAPITDWVDQFIEGLTIEAGAKSLFKKQYESTVERTVTDIADSFIRQRDRAA